MDQKRKRIGSALCAALLTVSLNGRVWADGDEQELPLEPPVQIVEDAPSETGETSSETGNDPADLDGTVRTESAPERPRSTQPPTAARSRRKPCS